MQLLGEITDLHNNQLAQDEISEVAGLCSFKFDQACHIATCQNQSPSKIAILLCTYQGQDYLAEQLDSFDAQTYPTWNVWASDDGSTDETLSILKTRQVKWGSDRLTIHAGPGNGFAANFLSLVCNPAIEADYFAFSDQDDIWEAGKLQRAMDWLNTVPTDVPALYCTRTQLVDASGGHIGYSPHFKKSPGFANALVQSIGGGNTMVFNQAARNLLSEAGENVDISSHDCWVYLVVSACGGRVFRDAYASLRYRQHGANIFGSNIGWAAKIQRINMLFGGYLKDWNDRNIKALKKLEARMTPENRHLYDTFALARRNWLLPRLLGIWQTGIYRQTRLGNLGLIVATLFKKI